MEIDLNCDLGEGSGHDAELIPLVTSVNVCCGFHAGDAGTAHQALALSAEHGVQAGAHPSFPDREHFGRVELERSAEQIYQDCVYQIGAVAALARAVGIELSHVKPHGALYHLACRDESHARPVIEAASLFGLPLMGLPGSKLEALCRERRAFIAEGFADRRYLANGNLVPRSSPDAFVEDTDEAVRQVDRLIREQGVRTICVHGDNPRALEFVRALRQALERAGIAIRKFQA